MNAFDFEVDIGPSTGRAYTVTARGPGGDATGTMDLPLTLDALDHQLAIVKEAVLASSAVVRRRPTRDEQPVQQLGGQLFDALLAGDVRGLYVASAQRAREQGEDLRLVLRVGPPELARVPWEFLFDPTSQEYLGLSLPLVRYPHVLAPRQPLLAGRPLRILGMIARPGDHDRLMVDDEQHRMRIALAGLEREGLVELVWVSGQTYSHLEDAMDRGPWHVFHFVGHGGYDSDRDEGTIALATEAGRTDQVGADDLSLLLTRHRTLRLVVLNACNTGRGSALDAFSSAAGALVRKGIPAVVAMQFEISDPAATTFAQAFYQNVAKRLPVDVSVMRARQALRRAKKDTLEWGTPVLYLRARDGRIFETAIAPPESSQGKEPHDDSEVEALYTQALSAFFTERWDEAVTLLRQVLARRPGHAATDAKLKDALRLRQLAARYAEGCAAADAADWDQAVAGFASVIDTDPAYRDADELLADARRQQQIAGLHAEARRLHRAGHWAAVVGVGDRLHTLDPATADPDGLVTTAREELAAAERKQQLGARYRDGLRLLDAGAWEEAREALEEVAELDSDYRDVAALLVRTRRELSAHASPPAGPRRRRHGAIHAEVLQTVRHGGMVNAVAFSPDGRWLATAFGVGYASRGVWILDTTTWTIRLDLKNVARFSSTVFCVAFSLDGRWLATGSNDKTARIWDTVNGQELVRVRPGGLLNAVHGVTFSPDGRWLAAGFNDGSARIWDAVSGRELARLTHDLRVTGIAFSPDGRWLATASHDKTARIWDAVSGRELARLTHDRWVTCIAFSPDGRWLATGDDDKTARIWDAANWQELTRLTHDQGVTSVAFSPDGRWLAASVGAARIWDAASGQELARLTDDTWATGVAFSPDGRWLATASVGNMVRIYALTEGSGAG